ncbi:ABC transporter ATP-binding protein [Salinadaptatus halalkaliphilus]|uniref:ABC transporter ATP-binding protein n=1 Tax=Salinadaptatus halalkaliphilus TaxID=2419781 RepID=A0A4S3TQS4_9EURY|nr:ABC transporter ATP-binding protein [Salinadaptatus halalkaliphilus]THE65673.1 ABC transporter ATP-binding protein [Salinadaptatus halalkaliphilus]
MTDNKPYETTRSHSERSLAIDATDVHVTYDDGTEAVRGLSLAVEAGECVGFLGPNGAGKTTTIRTLVTLLYPMDGTVSINGYDVRSDPRAVRESIGYMAQEASVDAELTARENVRFACDIYGVPRAERGDRVDRLLEVVGLADVADTRAGRFSGGMAKRLDAATALVHHPPVVFLDEPTVGLDPAARTQLWNYVDRLNEAGTTVFLTTQYVEQTLPRCDRLFIIDDGRLVASGTPETLISRVGGEILTLEIGGSGDGFAVEPHLERARRTVHELDGIDPSQTDSTPEGLTVTAEGIGDRAHELLIALSKADVPVTGFDLRSPTLEDVFVSLTGTRPERREEERR